jgi:hypothetical protein
MDSDDKIMMEVLQDDEAEVAAHLQRWNMGFVFLMQVWQQLKNTIPHRGGLRPSKSTNKNHHRDADAMLLHSDYFADNASNTPKEFRQRFRMNKDLCMKICARRERVRRLLQVQERLHWKVGVHVGSEMHGCPMVHCIWSSAGFNSGLSTHV